MERSGTQKKRLGCRFVLVKVTRLLHKDFRSSRHVSPRASRSQKPSRALRSGLHAGVSLESVGIERSVPTGPSVEPRSSRHGSPRGSGFGLEGSPNQGAPKGVRCLAQSRPGVSVRQKRRGHSGHGSQGPRPRCNALRRSCRTLVSSKRLEGTLEPTREGRVAGGPADERRGAIPVHVRFRTVEGTSACKPPALFAERRSVAGLGRREGSGGNSSSAPKLADDRRCPEGRSRGTRRGVPRSRPWLGLHDPRSRRLALREEGTFAEESLSPERRGRVARCPRSRALAPKAISGSRRRRRRCLRSAPPRGGPRAPVRGGSCVARIPDAGVVPSREGSAALTAREIVLRAEGTSGVTCSPSRQHISDEGGVRPGSPGAGHGETLRTSLVRAGEGRMLERACPCVVSGCRSRRAAPDRHDAHRPRSEARARRPSHSPTSDLPGTERARGKRTADRGPRERGSGPEETNGRREGGEEDAGSVPGMHPRSRAPRAALHSRGWGGVRVPRPESLGFEKWSSSMEGASGRGSRFAVTRGSGKAVLVLSGLGSAPAKANRQGRAGYAGG